jgi:NAD-dependent dihydropyrimidine dehydrogenase PreA subunit
MSEGIYQQLAKHLDEAHAGAPMSPTLMEIMYILYPGEEAEVACKLEFYANKTLAECQELFPQKADRMEELLDSMAHRGTVFTEQKPGRERIYRLLPSVVGYVEAPFLSGEDTPEKRALAPLWKKYLVEEYGRELARGIPLIRVIPIGESLEDESQVLPFDAIKEKLDQASFMAVGHCPCRQIGTLTGEGCDRPTERCMHFGSLGRYFVEMGMAREIKMEEALQILSSATEEGLVHVCDNVEGNIRTICNCCPCCCGFFRANQALGVKTYSSSNYVAYVDTGSCTGCATCEDRCPVGAISVGDVAQVDPDVCIGCGVCTPTCSGDDAIRLVVRQEVQPPPDFETFAAARMKRE